MHVHADINRNEARREIDAALDKIDLASYLDQQGVDYAISFGTRGEQLNLRECPACKGTGVGKTYINSETGLGNCFRGSCGFRFNRFKLIKEVSGLAGRELDDHIRSIAGDQGWMPKRVRKEIVKANLELPSKLIDLPIQGRNIAYLADRGIRADTAGYFGLSYCDGGWWSFISTEGEKRYMKFDARIIIPILDLEGTLVSFQGRDITGEQEPKYLFPLGFAVAGSHIYNGHNFEDGKHSHLVVGEGAFDAFAIYQALLGHASCEAMLAGATFGMHLSAGPGSQLEKLMALKERGLRTITMMWDSEKKAMALAIKEGLKLFGLGFTVRIARLPPGADPNQLADKTQTPPEVVRKAVFDAVLLNRLSAIRLMKEALAIS
jgi:DNA primase